MPRAGSVHSTLAMSPLCGDHQEPINLRPWLPNSLTRPDWCDDMNLWSVRTVRAGSWDRESTTSLLVIFISAAISPSLQHEPIYYGGGWQRDIIFLCRGWQLSCVYIARVCLTSSPTARVCLLVTSVTQQHGGCQNFKDVKPRVSFASIWICRISLTYSIMKF